MTFLDSLAAATQRAGARPGPRCDLRPDSARSGPTCADSGQDISPLITRAYISCCDSAPGPWRG